MQAHEVKRIGRAAGTSSNWPAAGLSCRRLFPPTRRWTWPARCGRRFQRPITPWAGWMGPPWRKVKSDFTHG